MAIQISGSTIIDNSRNIVNAGIVTATSFIGDGSGLTGVSGGTSVTTSDSAPGSPNDGDLWYDSVGGRTYVYYDDGDTDQWVDAAPQGGGVATSLLTGNSKAEIIDTGSDGRFVVTTEGVERSRVDNGGRTLLGGVTVNANGGVLQLSSGITFPATAVAATDANTLDDYEEGTWTPNVGPGVTAGGTVSTDGFYIKIGRSVTVWCRFFFGGSQTLSVSQGGTVCTNLPFTASGSGTINGTPGTGIDWSFTASLSCGAVSAALYNGPALVNNYAANYCITYVV